MQPIPQRIEAGYFQTARFIRVGQFALSVPELPTTTVPKVRRNDDAFPFRSSEFGFR